MKGEATGLALYLDYGTGTRQLLMECWPPVAAVMSQGTSEAVLALRKGSDTLNCCAGIPGWQTYLRVRRRGRGLRK